MGQARCALRLGFRQIGGFSKGDAEKLIDQRGAGYPHPEALWRRSGLGAGALARLAEADAFRSMGLDRRQALWAMKALGAPRSSALPKPTRSARSGSTDAVHCGP